MDKQHDIYSNYKQRFSETIDLTKNFHQEHEVSFNSTIQKKIGLYVFYINDKGIFYKKNTNHTEYQLFKSLDSLDFYPAFISENHSKYLIIKGSKYFNDNYIAQIWDIENQTLIKEFNTLDYPKNHATQNNFYFSCYDSNEELILKKFNFLDKKIYNTNFNSIFSFKVINHDKILTTIDNQFYLSSDETANNKPYFLFKNKDSLRFISYNNDDFFFYKNDKDKTVFYNYSIKENRLKILYAFYGEISLTKCILYNQKLYFSFIDKGKNNLSYINTLNHSLHNILANKLGSFKFINNFKEYLTVLYTSFKVAEIVYKLDNDGVLSIISETNSNSIKNYNVKQEWVAYEKDSVPLHFIIKMVYTKVTLL